MDKIRERVAAECAKLFERLEIERAKYPPRRTASGWTDTYWDGSFGPVHKYEIWTAPDPDPQKIRTEFDRETDKIQRNADKHAYGHHKHDCGAKKCYWHE